MLPFQSPLLTLYLTLTGWVLGGFLLGRLLPERSTSYLGKFLYWFGVPLSIIAFMRRTQLSTHILIAPITAWIAILVGAALAWVWIDLELNEERLRFLAHGLQERSDLEEPPTGQPTKLVSSWRKPTQGSFLLAMMLGNTAYLGFPVILSLVGPQYFGWAILYNTLGTTLGTHGLGATLAAHYGKAKKQSRESLFLVMLRNPGLWSFAIGALTQNMPLPAMVDRSLQLSAWGIVNFSLMLIGMQLSQLRSLRKLPQASTCLIIKMVLVPLVVGTGLMFFGITGMPRLTLVLQMAMPPSFATVLYAEAYQLDRDLTVTTVAFGSAALLFTLPVWLWLFAA